MCCNFSLFSLLIAKTVPETKSQHDLSNSFWHELSSPYTESSDENVGETTTHVHEPFFEENSTQINVTTQLGSDVYLHCRVNDLREKMVSKVYRCLPAFCLVFFLFRLMKKTVKTRKVFDVLETPQRLFNIANTSSLKSLIWKKVFLRHWESFINHVKLLNFDRDLQKLIIKFFKFLIDLNHKNFGENYEILRRFWQFLTFPLINP